MGLLGTRHGGSDPGATGNIIEKEYNLKIANYIYNRLKELGVPVAITRTTDVAITPTDRVNKILNAFGNSDDVVVLSNHLNAGGGVNPSSKLAFFENLYNNLPKYGIMITEKAVFNL